MKNYQVTDRLWARFGIVCRRQWSNEEGVRLPVALFNIQGDMDRVVAALREVAAEA